MNGTESVKLSDFIMGYLSDRGLRHLFGMSGGAAVHLFDSAARHPDIRPVFFAHEQSAAMAADAYYRVSGRMGVCAVTSGPGATNLLTGVCCSYYDSVPTVMLTGQVATHRLKGDRKVRQVGFQETDVLSIFASVTKFAAQLRDPSTIAQLLDQAFEQALDGRPGPVLIDIPDDLQRAMIEPARSAKGVSGSPNHASREAAIADARLVLRYISEAKRPVLVLGGGLSTPRVQRELRQFLSQVQLPILQTWAGLDLVPFDWKHRYGTFGVYGPRLGNFIVQNADLIVCLGTRLSQNLTGGLLHTFAPRARIVMVDADAGEMSKFDGRGIAVEHRMQHRLKDFLKAAIEESHGYRVPEFGKWLSTIQGWRSALPDDIPARPSDGAGYVDAIDVVRTLSSHLADSENLIVDTGGNLTWTCNNLRVKASQRVISAWNFTPMGYALPAAIGAALATPDRPATCIIGDGGQQLCLGELSTVVRYNLPIKIILFNNHSHGIQKQTLETWLEGRYVGVDPESGLGLADFPKVAASMGLPVITISRSSEISKRLRELYAMSGPVFCNVEINPDQKLYPVLKYGASLESQTPQLPPELAKILRARGVEN